MDLTELDYLERAEALQGKLYGIALLTLGGEAAAIDAVDEAVYKGYRNYRKLRQPQYFETWLIRILINVCRDELRRRKRELAVETLPETAGDAYDALPLFLPDGRDGPEHPARCCYYLTGYSWDTLTASLSYTDIVTPPEPLTIPLS